MLVSEIGTRVKRAFGDEAGVQIDDNDIIRWINDAQKEISSAQAILEVSATATIAAGQENYTLPADVQNLFSVWYDGSKLNPMSMREAEEYITAVGTPSKQPSGPPQICWAYAEVLHFWPIPSQTITDGLKLFYSRFPVAVTSINDTPELDVKYHKMIVDYCLQQAYELDEDWQASQTKASQFSENLSGMSNDEKWTQQGLYPTITVLQGDL